jgi:hypothetical protein
LKNRHIRLKVALLEIERIWVMAFGVSVLQDKEKQLNNKNIITSLISRKENHYFRILINTEASKLWSSDNDALFLVDL